MFSWLFGAKKKSPPASPSAPSLSAPYHEPPAPPFPYPVQIVRTERAMAVFEAIKAAGQGMPLLLGSADDVANLAHMADLAATSPEIIDDTFQMAASFDFPYECWKFADGTIPDIHDDIAHLRANPGPWPDRVEAMSTLPAIIDGRDGRPRAKICVATIPTNDNTAIPAFLNFGGWNACPYPHVFVAALRKWRRDWGAELIAITSDTMDVRFPRRPTTRAAALELYLEMVALQSDTLMDGEPSQFAAKAMVSEYWQFWWD